MDGLAPTTVDEWVDALVEQLNEPTVRRAERGAATRRVAEAHSYDTWESRWRDAVGLTVGAAE
jgi:hypothetical protein